MKRKKLTKMCAWLMTAVVINLSPVQAAEPDNEISLESEEPEIGQDASEEEVESGSENPEEALTDSGDKYETEDDLTIETEQETEQDTAAEVFSSEADPEEITESEGETFTDETANPLETGITELKGRMYINNSDIYSEFQTADITTDVVEERTMDDKKQTWRVINLTFPADALKQLQKGNTTFKFDFRVKTEDSETPISAQIQISGSYYLCDGDSLREGPSKNYNSTTDLWTPGFVTKSVMYGESTEKWTSNAYCIYKNNNKVIRYKINIIKQGCAGVQHEPLYNESNPVPVNWVYDEDSKMYMADINELSKPLSTNSGTMVYDENGVSKGSLKWNKIASRDPDADFYMDDNYLYVKKAGQYNIYKASWAGKDYYMPVRFTYDLYTRAPKALEELQTDGVTFMDSYANADSFATAFPEKDREKARAYYKLVNGLQKTLDGTEYGGTRRGEWDYSVYNRKWTDSCESVKIDQAKSEYASVWENIFGMKDAKDTIISYIDLEHSASDKQEKLKELQETYLNRLEQDYQAGKIMEILDVQDILTEMQQAVDAVKYYSLNNCTVTLKTSSYTYDGKAKKPEVSVKDAEGRELPSSEYMVTYKNNVNAGTAVVTVTGQNTYRGIKTLNFTIKKVNILKNVPSAYTRTEGDKAFNLNIKTNIKATLGYTSSDKNVVTVNAKGAVAVKGPGRAVITVKASAPNVNTQYARISIVVKPSNKLAVSAKVQKGRKLQVSWKRNSKVSGYQIAISTDKKFRKNVKTVTINNKKTNRTTIKKLKNGKRYYVRVRCFKKTSGGTVYGDWKNSGTGALLVK